MKYFVPVIILCLLSIPVFGQTAKTKTSQPKTTPTISLENQMKYFKARSNQFEAQLVLEHAQKQVADSNQALQTLIPVLSAECGAGFVLQLDENKNLLCVENKSTK